MSKSFDEWFDNQNIENWTNKKYMLQAYEAGAASRQAEIDELNNEFETMRGMYEAVSLYADELFNERDELQKRIDKVIKILKGEQDDN